MRLFKTGLIALAALATLGASTTSFAATVATTLNVSLSFYDIDPLDGVGPTFSFLSGPRAASRTGIDNYPSASIRDDSEWSSSTADANGDASSYINYQPETSTQGTFAQYVLPVGGTSATVWSVSYLWRFIELGSGTGVSVSSTSSINTQGLTQRQVASSNSTVTIYDSKGYYTGPYLSCCGFGENTSRSNSGAVSYENTGSQTASIYIGTHISSELVSYSAAAIPEPETYALLLAGLGIIGAVARRRAKARALYS